MGRTGASFDQKSIGFDYMSTYLATYHSHVRSHPQAVRVWTKTRPAWLRTNLFSSHGSRLDYFVSGKRDQDFRTFPENLKGYFKIYFSNHLFLAGTVPTNLYIYIYIYIYIYKNLIVLVKEREREREREIEDQMGYLEGGESPLQDVEIWDSW